LSLGKPMRRREFIAALGSAAAMPLAARATTWPTQVVRIICPIAAGGGIDATSRIVAAQLSQIWGQQAVVENKTGGGGNIAAQVVAHSDPDGYTIYVAAFFHATNRYLYTSLSYDPVTDFAPVALICLYPLMMVVPNISPAHSVSEFIAYAKANKLSYASGGHGTSLHLAGELFKRQAGIEMTHVPYRGAGPAFNDLIPGRVDAMFNFVLSSLPLVRQGQLRALAVLTDKRLSVANRRWPRAGLRERRSLRGLHSSFPRRRPNTSLAKYTPIQLRPSQRQRSKTNSNKAVPWSLAPRPTSSPRF
jgi:tripartite-type tricarboxylate transporter receptor subunit TctC